VCSGRVAVRLWAAAAWVWRSGCLGDGCMATPFHCNVRVTSASCKSWVAWPYVVLWLLQVLQGCCCCHPWGPAEATGGCPAAA
jgi:hypothetical protein